MAELDTAVGAPHMEGHRGGTRRKHTFALDTEGSFRKQHCVERLLRRPEGVAVNVCPGETARVKRALPWLRSDDRKHHHGKDDTGK